MKMKLENVSLPTCNEHLNIEQLQKIALIDSSLEDIDRFKEAVTIITDLSREIVDMLGEEDLIKISKHISFIYDDNPEIYTIDKNTIWTIDNVDYGVIKEDFKLIEWLETLNISTDTDLLKSLPTMLPVIIRRIKEKNGDEYILEDYNSNNVEMEYSILKDYFNGKDIFSICFFLSKLVMTLLIKTSGISRLNQMTKELKNKLNNTGFQKDGDGSQLDGK